MEFEVEIEVEPEKHPTWEWRPTEGPVMDDLIGVECLLRGKRVLVLGMGGYHGAIRCYVRFQEGDTTCWAKLTDLTPA